MPLAKVLLDNLNNAKIIGVTLSQEEKLYLNNLINNNAEVFEDIVTNISLMIKDGKINIYEIPEIIYLICEIYNKNILPELINNVDIINLVQYTIDSLLESSILPLSKAKLLMIEKLVDTSFKLLKMNIKPIKRCIAFCC